MTDARVCALPECDGRVHSKGLCKSHYEKTRPRPQCTTEGCTNKQIAREMCSTHYSLWHFAQTKYEVTCPRCGKTVRRPRKSSKYCSQRCGSLDAAEHQARCWSSERAKKYSLVKYDGPAYAWRLAQKKSDPPARKGRWKSCQCVVCDKRFLSIQFDATCSDECKAAKSAADKRRLKDRRRARERAAYVEDVDRKRVFEMDGYRCYICRRKTDPTKKAPHPRAPTLDHLVPLAAGGRHEAANCRCACFSCNARKGDRGGGEQLMLVG